MCLARAILGRLLKEHQNFLESTLTHHIHQIQTGQHPLHPPNRMHHMFTGAQPLTSTHHIHTHPLPPQPHPSASILLQLPRPYLWTCTTTTSSTSNHVRHFCCVQSFHPRPTTTRCSYTTYHLHLHPLLLFFLLSLSLFLTPLFPPSSSLAMTPPASFPKKYQTRNVRLQLRNQQGLKVWCPSQVESGTLVAHESVWDVPFGEEEFGASLDQGRGEDVWNLSKMSSVVT